MKKYLYFASAALISVTLASCEKTPEPVPDPEPQPTENVVNVTLNAFTVEDYFEEDGDYTLIFLGSDDNNVVYYAQFDILPETATILGTYPVCNTDEVGTAVASEGFNADYEYDTPSFLGVYTDADGHYDETYYFVDGQVVVSYPEDGKIAIAGSATSYYGSTITFSYEGAYAWQTDDDTAESPAALSKKLQAKASAHAAKLMHRSLTSLAARK